MAQQNRIYKAKSLKDSEFEFYSHVEIDGDVDVEHGMFVAGNLYVKGNLKTASLDCLGRVTVEGNLEATSVRVANVLTVGGKVHGGFMHIGCRANDVIVSADLGDISIVEEVQPAKRLRMRDTAYDDTTTKAFLDDLPKNVRDNYYSLKEEYADPALVAFMAESVDAIRLLVTGSVVVQGLLKVFRDIDVSFCLMAKRINCSRLQVGELLRCRENLLVEREIDVKRLVCDGSIHAKRINVATDFSVFHQLLAKEVRVGQNLQVGGDIFVLGQVMCGHYVKAGGKVIAASLEAGEDYGIFAGMALPRSQWEARGYVSTSEPAPRLLSGVFVPDKWFADEESFEDCWTSYWDSLEESPVKMDDDTVIEIL